MADPAGVMTTALEELGFVVDAEMRGALGKIAPSPRAMVLLPQVERRLDDPALAVVRQCSGGKAGEQVQHRRLHT